MPKNKPHKGLLKRVKVTRNGKIKLHRAFGRHLRSHKSGQTIRKYRLPAYAAASDMRRLRSLLGLPVARTARTRPTTEPTAEPTAETRTETPAKPAKVATKPAKDAAKPPKGRKKKVSKSAEAAKD